MLLSKKGEKGGEKGVLSVILTQQDKAWKNCLPKFFEVVYQLLEQVRGYQTYAKQPQHCKKQKDAKAYIDMHMFFSLLFYRSLEASVGHKT